MKKISDFFLIETNKKYFLYLGFILTITFLYLLFLNNIFNSKFNFWNSDAMIKMFPSRVYIHERLSNGEFPFWSERVFLGYPLYLDMELGILNPINIILIYLFGPVWSLKILHFLTYLLGSLSIFYLINKLFSKNTFLISLIGVTAFYFSFFHLNHLIHMNMVLVSMVLPIHIYLAIKYLENSKKRYLFWQIILITYTILWGQPQPIFFNLTALGLFFYFQSSSIKSTVKYLLFVVSISFFLTLPQLYPTFKVFLETSRGEGVLKYSWFTNSPTLSLNLIFPYLLGYYQNFQGFEVSGAYSFVETYNYIGISLFVVSLFYLLFGWKDSFFKLYLSIVVFYLFITFLNIFFESQIPVYNTFRYWTRAVYLISFFSFIPIGFLFSNLKMDNIKFNYVLGIIFFLIFAFLFEDRELLNFIVQNSFIYLRKIDILIWFLVGLITVLLVLISRKYSKYSQIIYASIFLIIIFDLKYFSSDFIPLRISRYNSEKSFVTYPECINQRCLFEDKKHSGYNFLIFKTFSPFGYSQFVYEDYHAFFDTNIKGNVFQSNSSKEVRLELNLEDLKKYGFIGILLDDDKFIRLKDSGVWLFQENIPGKIINSSEGNLELQVEIPETRTYNLNQKYSENFIVLVNEKEVKLQKEGIFSKIDLEKGSANIKIKYFPYDVLIPFLVGIFLIFVTLAVVKLFKFKIINK